MFFKKFFIFLLFFVPQTLLSCELPCEVKIFGCGQGNAVAAYYNSQAIIFDAGSKAYQAFAQQQEDADDETEYNKNYIIVDKQDEGVYLYQTPLPERVKTLNSSIVDELKEDLSKRFAESFQGKTLQGVFISHPDEDHLNMLNGGIIGTAPVVLGGRPTHQNYATIKPFVSNENMIAAENFNKVSFKGDEAPAISLLAYNQGSTPNDNSLVVKLQASHSILLPGDATKITWEAVVHNAVVQNDENQIKSDVLLISHHGAHRHGCTTSDILTKIQPKLCLISAGLRYNHPKLETIKTLITYFRTTSESRTTGHLVTCFAGQKLCSYFTNAPIFTTIDNGDLKINLSSSPLTPNSERDFFYVPGESFSNDNVDTYFTVVGKRPFKEYKAEDFIPMGEEIYQYKEDKTYWLKVKKLCFQCDAEVENLSESDSDEEN